jgi:hypothetical protein
MVMVVGALIFCMLMAAALSHAAQIQVSWSPNTETDLAGYKLYSGTASGVYGDPVDVGNVTSHALTLSPAVGTTYYFAVTAYDTSGNESGFSSEASVFIKDGQPPAAPKGIIAKIIAAISALLRLMFSWA